MKQSIRNIIATILRIRETASALGSNLRIYELGPAANHEGGTEAVLYRRKSPGQLCSARAGLRAGTGVVGWYLKNKVHGHKNSCLALGAQLDERRVTIEFFGIPRQRAGCAALAVEATTVRELLAQVEQACPGLMGILKKDGQLSPHYLVSIEGRQFLTDMDQSLCPGDRLVLLSADAGG